jgi:hypothetical protein
VKMFRLRETWGIWLVMLLLGTTTIWLGLLLPEPLVFEGRVDVSPSVMRAGQPVALTVTRCNRTPTTLDYTTAWQLVREDADLHILLPPGGNVAPPGCFTYDGLTEFIPATTPPGRYHAMGVVTIPTAWRIYTTTFDTTSFTVVP